MNTTTAFVVAALVGAVIGGYGIELTHLASYGGKVLMVSRIFAAGSGALVGILALKLINQYRMSR